MPSSHSPHPCSSLILLTFTLAQSGHSSCSGSGSLLMWATADNVYNLYSLLDNFLHYNLLLNLNELKFLLLTTQMLLGYLLSTLLLILWLIKHNNMWGGGINSPYCGFTEQSGWVNIYTERISHLQSLLHRSVASGLLITDQEGDDSLKVHVVSNIKHCNNRAMELLPWPQALALFGAALLTFTCTGECKI